MRVAVAIAAFAAGCATASTDQQTHDGSAVVDAAFVDLAKPDLAHDVDGGVTDSGFDLAPGDLAHVDLAQPDLAQPDLAQPDLAFPIVDGGTGCDPTSQTLGANGGPDTCNYGDYCGPSHVCVAAPVGTCAEASGAPAWSILLADAPVITTATATLLDSTATMECENGDPAALVTVSYYTPHELTTSNDTGAFEQEVQWKKSTSANGTWYPATFVRMLPVPNAHFGMFQVGINCGGASGTAREASLYVLDDLFNASNTVCVSW